jgi:hypothetical protein
VHWSFCSHSELFYEDIEFRIPPNSTAASTKITQLLSTGTDHLERVQRFAHTTPASILDVTASGFNIERKDFIIHDGEVPSAKLRHCITSLETFLVELNSITLDDCDSIRILALWNAVTYIKLAIAKSQKPPEIAYDDYLEQFQDIAKLLREMVGPGAGSKDFSLFTSFLQVLRSSCDLVVGAKCRDWLVRRCLCSL